MPSNPVLKRFLDAGVQFTEMSQQTAEKLVSELVNAGQLRRKDAAETVQTLVDRGRASTEQLVTMIQSEVGKQLVRIADRIDDLEDMIEDLGEELGLRAKEAKEAAPAAPSAPAKKAPAEKAPAKKAPAKKAPAKKAPAKKAPAKKAPAKKAPAKKAAGSSGVAKVATKKPAV
jgi:polyhydroxyalkanoate synthesis regulator phasin